MHIGTQYGETATSARVAWPRLDQLYYCSWCVPWHVADTSWRRGNNMCKPWTGLASTVCMQRQLDAGTHLVWEQDRLVWAAGLENDRFAEAV